MAVARVEFCWDASQKQRRAVIEAVAEALVAELKVPVGDPTAIGGSHRAEDTVFPAKVADRYTIVTITMFAGRTTETKRLLYRRVVERRSSCDVGPDDVLIVLDEVPVENWGVGGGISATQVDVGFKIDIRASGRRGWLNGLGTAPATRDLPPNIATLRPGGTP
jgi:phenylpyruvate tautomerase PptA (4-oxalocrotonate tautomerase family)